jgi:hypothetical protein
VIKKCQPNFFVSLAFNYTEITDEHNHALVVSMIEYNYVVLQLLLALP